MGGGDLDVQVPEEEGDDEIAMLGRLFNQMTRQLKGQRDALLDTNRQTEGRRRLFDFGALLRHPPASSASTRPATSPSSTAPPNASLRDVDIAGRALPLAVAIPEFEPLLQNSP